eukprot:jgi/Ulvmu1/10548/UM065_0001.1
MAAAYLPEIDLKLNMRDCVEGVGRQRLTAILPQISWSSFGLSRLLRVLNQEVPADPLIQLTCQQVRLRAGGEPPPSACNVLVRRSGGEYGFCNAHVTGGDGNRYTICRRHLGARTIYCQGRESELHKAYHRYC